MFSKVSVVDIIQSVGVIFTILFSVISLVQSRNANVMANSSDKMAKDANDLAKDANDLAKDANDLAKDANEIAKDASGIANIANDISKKALDDSQKDYMPLVRFCGKFDVVSKSIKTLRNQITFDFNEEIVDISRLGPGISENSELVCITTEIENCGRGIIKGILINNFIIQSGNKVALDINSEEDLETLCYIEYPENQGCQEEFILLPKEKTMVNFIISKHIIDSNGCKLKDAQEKMKNFQQAFDNIMIFMSLSIASLNDTSYQQKFLTGTYLGGEIVHNAFSNVKCS